MTIKQTPYLIAAILLPFIAAAQTATTTTTSGNQSSATVNATVAPNSAAPAPSGSNPAANAEGEKLGLTADELAFYDALTKPQAIKDFYEHDELIAITKELTDLLRKNRTIDWQKKESARAGMRRLVKRLLKKYKYPPEGMDDAVQTVMSQCEMWVDNL